MPQRSATIAAPGYDAATLLALGYGTFISLEWESKYSATNMIIGYTQKQAEEVTVETNDGQVTITSKLIHGEGFDMPGRNKKNIAKFETAWQSVKGSATEMQINEWNQALLPIMEETRKLAAEQIKEAEEADKVMKLSSGNMNATWLIMAANVVIFILMAIDGAGIIDAYPLVHIKWGSNFSFLTLTGDWWRLFTCTYIHFGIIHLAMNMYALYMAGAYLEPMLGKTRYITAYTACGILASVASLWWHTKGVNSAGASGAVFGLYGLFLALLLTNLIPVKVRQPLLQTTAIFVGYNLLYGMKGGIDNAAHIGGLVSGFIIGLFYTWTIRKEQQERNTGWAGPLVLVLAIVIAYFYIRQNSLLQAAPAPKEIVEEEKISYPDDNIYNEKYYQFMQMNGRAMAIYNYRNISYPQLKDTIKKVSNRYLDSAGRCLDEMKGMRVSANTQQKSALLQKYIAERKKEMALMLRIIDKGETGSLMQELEDTRTRAKELFETAINLPSN